MRGTKFMKKLYVLAVPLFAISIFLLTSCAGDPPASTADYIGIDKAKEAALQAAGISADSVSFSSASLDSRNGIYYYQVIFSNNGTEWEYDVDALTGVIIEEKVLSAESVAEETSPAGSEEIQESSSGSPEETAVSSSGGGENPSSSSGPLDSASALAAALGHAQLTEEEVSFSKVESDYDDGVSVFEVEFVSKDGTEYDYKVNADDGSIISFDQDAELSLPPSAESSGMISEDQAKEAVLSRVPGANVSDISIHLKEDDGRMEYTGRLLYDGMLYEFKIDAYSGGLIEWEAERY